MEDEEQSKCNDNCCVQNLVLLFEGEEFRRYLEHHVANYRLHKRDISISLQDVHSLVPSNVFEEKNTDKGEILLRYINGMGDTGGSTSLPHWDGAIFPAQLTGGLQESNQLWDWNDYISRKLNSENSSHDDNTNIDWLDIQPFFRSQAQQVEEKSSTRASSLFLWKSSNDRSTKGVTRRILYAPLDGDVISIFYRKDLFEQYQIKIPRTWDEFRDVAIFFHDKPWGPNNTTLTGSCVARKSSETSKNMDAYWASLVLSTMTQTKGTSSGFLLDPETLEPILGGAMEETLRILAHESMLGDGNDHSNIDDENDGSRVTWGLHEDSCAMTLGLADQLTIATIDDYKILNNIGVAPTPGSIRVLNRASGHLETCTPELCPFGTYYDDIGIVNRPSYSVSGGWVGGVSNDSTSSKQHDVADFFSYISNPVQSLSDALPNERSHFVGPYRYSHTASLSWVGAGFDEATAMQYTETINKVNSENTVSDIRISQGTAIREIINQGVNAYLLTSSINKDDAPESLLQGASLRSEITAIMDERIRDAITSVDMRTVKRSYQSSLSFPGHKDVNMNYIDMYYRDTGWGLAVLICFMSIVVVFWILWNRKKSVMQAFQPTLLIQSAVGFFFMGVTIFPLGFDDSLFSKEILDITCMATPWIYVFGYTVFFSSIYSKIQACTEVYKTPGKYERMVVQPIDSVKLFCKLIVLNGVLLSLWTLVDPLKWSRIEMTNGRSSFPDRTLESYGSCKSERFKYPAFAIALFVFNLLCSFLAMLQALRCRLLVLEYRQMQWLQLCIVPFFEAWIIGGPVITILHDQPTAHYVVFVMIIASSCFASASAIFAPKEWYIRKHNILANEKKLLPNESDPETPPTPSRAGVRVLKHPKFESQKHVSNLQNRLVRYKTSNTELAIDIRVLQERFRLLSEKEKMAVIRGMYAEGITRSQIFRTTVLEEDEASPSDNRDSHFLTIALQDMKSHNQIDTVIAKHSSSNGRVSELSIDIDDLNQLRADVGKFYSQDDDYGPFAGKSVRSIVELIESISAASFALKSTSGSSFNKSSKTYEESCEEVAPTTRQQHVTSQKAQSSNLNGGSCALKTNCNGDVEEAALGGKSNHILGTKMNNEMEGLNQMIESDNIGNLQSEIMMMAENFKTNSSFLEDVSDLYQPGITVRDEEDLHQIIESDKIRELQSETEFMAEKFKLNNSFLESISDLQPCSSEKIVGDSFKHDELHTLDVSNATATSVSTMATENGGKDFTMPSVVPIIPASEGIRDSSESMVVSSAGESSAGHVLAFERNCEKGNEENSRQQDAGEPSGDCGSQPKFSEDMVAENIHTTETIHTLNPNTLLNHERPKSSPRSSASSTSTSASVGLDPQVDTSHSNKNIRHKPISINGWTPTSRMGGLLADLSDSTSTQSRASTAPSISSLEIVPSPKQAKVRMGKDIEKLLNYHGFDAIKVQSEIVEGYVGDKNNDTSPQKLSNTRLRKRELEAKRLSIRRHQQKGTDNP